MEASALVDPKDTLERQNAKLLTIVGTLMRRAEARPDTTGVAYAQFERAVRLEEEVRARTLELEHALDLLNTSNASLARANAEAQAARANLANAIETVQEGFALFDANETLVLCNTRFGKHMRDVHHLFKPGLPFADYVRIVSQSPFLELPDGTTPQEWQDRRMTRHREQHVVFNARMAGDRWLQVSEHRTRDGGTVVLQTDVTDMMLIERQERERLLDDQARLIKATLEHLKQGVGIFDREARLVGWNRRLGELLSIPLRRFRLGLPFATIFEQLSRKLAFQSAADAEALCTWASQTRARAALTFEVELGADRILAVFAQTMPDGGFVISFTDITTERRALRAISQVNETLERRVQDRTLELRDALADAERANASKSRFVAAASHDLLQPLSAAKLYMAALDSDLDNDEHRDRLAKASSALQSVEDILGALLDISRLDSGRAAVHRAQIPLGVLLRQLHDEFAPAARDKNLRFDLRAPDTTVQSDATYLRRILQNLIANALRYTDQGRVLIGTRRRGDCVTVEIWDTGPGIALDQQTKVFDEFHRIHAPASPAEGLGLGLAIVERACRLLDHPLSLQSDPGRGTRFCVTLPLACAPAAPNPSLPPVPPDRTPLAHRIILLVENDAELREAITMTLENWGAEVLSCGSDVEALDLLREIDIAPDVVLADYQLENGATGTDLISVLRALYGPLPACVITANRDPEVTALCQKLQAPLLHKPLDLEHLQKALQNAPNPDA
ncbi:hybrid sensor histidine kinase/response regulator [Shimia marina]|uniref:histidine kinase n=1 Tax=Shimia marina TaxID=321267 RepID=A0A0P1EU33_9RHOB|nr:PAS-domain containing protein [Shimia marina]CUH54143.1 Aerobic respiration control sensor protein ArcB [Shimia marina]SFD96555.1 Response regulator receiver domain-containing protein [Shimia marina]